MTPDGRQVQKRKFTAGQALVVAGVALLLWAS
jgi:hypothetical protein